ncbi:MAG: sigma-54 dependent transcriptional regulator [Deltaproteobacteria bacterium]|nr:sigma-54 dependent transcriptional regulator [Deltaproteobacteria bacterium]
MNILLIDDEADVRKSLSRFLEKLGHTVFCAADGMEGLREFHSHEINLVVTDIRMPEIDGLELLRRIKVIEKSPVDVIVVTGHGDTASAVKALKYGAFDYLQKPIDVRELAIVIERSADYVALRNNYRLLKQEFQERVGIETQAARGEVERLRAAYLEEVGLQDFGIYSEAMRQVASDAERYSTDREMPVLIEGESGTGKELIARYIHYCGGQSAVAPFVAINCGAISQELFEGELFGHDPGAYTGATQRGQMGKIEAANGGTLFLDEIGELPHGVQVKLLRVLEEKKLNRLGSVREIPIDIRIISATNKNLEREVEAKRFRLDLFYRVNMGHIRIPPLRERAEDILPLAFRFAERAARRRGQKFGGFTPAAERFLLAYPWPGNVRQLKNAAERLVLMQVSERADLDDLAFIRDGALGEKREEGASVLGAGEFRLPEEGLDIEALNRRIIRMALEKHGGNRTRTAAYLGLSRRVLEGRLKKLTGA